jgi:nitrite reductase (NADH) small subunit
MSVAWIRVARVNEIPEGRGVLVEHQGFTAAVFNRGGGRFAACGATCPHEEGPLAEGWLEHDAVVCPWHGYDYDLLTGQCRADDTLSIPVYPVRVNGDTVEVDLP